MILGGSDHGGLKTSRNEVREQIVVRPRGGNQWLSFVRLLNHRQVLFPFGSTEVFDPFFLVVLFDVVRSKRISGLPMEVTVWAEILIINKEANCASQAPAALLRQSHSSLERRN